MVIEIKDKWSQLSLKREKFMKVYKSILKVQILSFILASMAWSMCPYEFKIKNESYCLNVDWVNGDRKVQGKWSEVSDQSPHLNSSTIRPEQWIYSKAYVDVWLASDQDQKPIYVEGLEVYPFMMMLGGHSHGAKSNWQYDLKSQRYILSQLNFQEMKNGCWQLRMKMNNEAETAIMNIDRFVNISVEANYDQSVMCSLCEAEAGTGVSGHSH